MKKTDKEFIKKAYCSVPMYIGFVDKLKINMDNIENLDSLPLITKEMVA